MRMLVMSDLHRRRSAFEKAIEQQPDAVQVVFLGDGAEEAAELSSFYPDRVFHIFSGNCDFASKYPASGLITVAGVRILATHGHPYSVKSTTERLREAAVAAGASIALYGHTHVPRVEYKNGLYLVCPGALCGSDGYAGYAVIDLTPTGIFPNLIRL